MLSAIFTDKCFFLLSRKNADSQQNDLPVEQEIGVIIL